MTRNLCTYDNSTIGEKKKVREEKVYRLLKGFWVALWRFSGCFVRNVLISQSPQWDTWANWFAHLLFSVETMTRVRTGLLPYL